MRRRAPLPRVPPSAVELIRRHGAFRPVVARRLGAHHEILAELGTWLAAQLAGHVTVPVKVLEGVDDDEADRIIEADSDGPLIRAERYRRQLDEHGGPGAPHAMSAVAREAGVSRATVAHALRLLALPDLVKQAVATGALTTGHAKALASPSLDDARRLELASTVIEQRWNVRRLEDEIAGGAEPCRLPGDRAVERRLAKVFGTSVRVRRQAGVVEIRYGDEAGLEALLARLGAVGR